jgi:hypothetical protein
MKITLLAFVLIGGIAFFILSCTNKPKEKANENVGELNTQPKKIDSNNNPFQELRNKAFNVTAKELGIILSENETKVYGIVMDWEMGGATASTVAFQTGDASLYLSSGGGVIGGGTHQNVKIAAKNFVKMADSFFEKSTKTENNTLPEANSVNFYLLTNKGVYVAREKMENFENNSSEWISLFEQGNRVLTELRNISDK